MVSKTRLGVITHPFKEVNVDVVLIQVIELVNVLSILRVTLLGFLAKLADLCIQFFQTVKVVFIQHDLVTCTFLVGDDLLFQVLLL